MAKKAYSIKLNNGIKSGGLYFSSGFKVDEEFISPAYVFSKLAKKGEANLDNLGLVYHFAEQMDAASDHAVFALSGGGYVSRTLSSAPTSWTADKTLAEGIEVGGGGGMIVDFNGSLVIAGNRYLHKRTNAVSPTGEWTDNWKDLGAPPSSYYPYWHPMDIFGDRVLVGNNNKIAAYSGDGTDFTATLRTLLPTGWAIRSLKVNGNRILVGANWNPIYWTSQVPKDEGILVMWDGVADKGYTNEGLKFQKPIWAVTPYQNGWLVMVGGELIYTNGHTYESLGFIPDMGGMYELSMEVYPNALKVRDNTIFVGMSFSGWNGRIKGGTYVYHIPTRSWSFIPPSDGKEWYSKVGAYFLDHNEYLYSSTKNGKYGAEAEYARVDRLAETGATGSHFTIPISIADNTLKELQRCLLDISLNSKDISYVSNPNISVELKTYDYRKGLWNYQQANAAASAANQIKVDGTVGLYDAQAGDEITVLDGVNAGKVAHISSIANDGTNTEAWTLDRNLAGNTEDDVYIQVCPFKKATGTISITSQPLKNNYPINLLNYPKGKKFLLKVYTTFASLPEFYYLTAIYDDRGYF